MFFIHLKPTAFANKYSQSQLTS